MSAGVPDGAISPGVGRADHARLGSAASTGTVGGGRPGPVRLVGTDPSVADGHRRAGHAGDSGAVDLSIHTTSEAGSPGGVRDAPGAPPPPGRHRRSPKLNEPEITGGHATATVVTTRRRPVLEASRLCAA